MKAVTHGSKIKDKYNKKKTYLMHYQLLEEWGKGKGVMMKVNLFMFIGFYLIWHSYPMTLASLDFSFAVVAMIFFFVVKPKMLKGDIQAYYRRDYSEIKWVMRFVHFFIMGGAVRCAVLALYYGITFFLVKENHFELNRYQEIVTEIIINPAVWVIALVASALVVYILFYHERYTSIREFSNRVIEFYSSNNLTEQGAVKEFMIQKDKELALENINGVKYDGDWFSTTSSNSEYKESSHKEYSTVTPVQITEYNFEEKNNEPESSSDTIRRRARR